MKPLVKFPLEEMPMSMELIVFLAGGVIIVLLGVIAFFLSKAANQSDHTTRVVETALPLFKQQVEDMKNQIQALAKDMNSLASKLDRMNALQERIAIVEYALNVGKNRAIIDSNAGRGLEEG